MAVPATIAGLARLIVVIGLPVATVVPTVEAKPQTIAGIALSSGSLEAWTIAALPIPTQTAATIGCEPNAAIVSSVKDEITTPVRFEAMLCFRPEILPPKMKNEAHAMKVTHTGTGIIVAVR